MAKHRSSRAKTSSFGRRGFLKGAAAGAAALAAQPQIGKSQQEVPAHGSASGSGAATPPAQRLARETGGAAPLATARVIERPGSDFIVEVLKTLDIEYLAANPGSTFESLHESIINYGPKPNTMPEFLTACHEESAVAMCHGYYKIEGKPMMALLHGDIGLQHAGMAIYNAYADRVPVL